MTPAEKAAAAKPKRPRRKVPPRKRPVVWVCTLGERRKALGLSLKDVAKGSGISLPTVHQIEHGNECELTTARKLCAFFGATVEELWPRRAE